MFCCRAYEACHLLQTWEIQSKVNGFGPTAHSLWNYAAASPVSVTKEQTCCYNKSWLYVRWILSNKTFPMWPVKT